MGLLSFLGCKELTGSQSLPAGTQNPATFETPAGALGMRAVVLTTFEQALPSILVDAGLLTDELESNFTGASLGLTTGSTAPAYGSLDERILPEQNYGASGTSADKDYGSLQQVRGLASQALGALAAFDTGEAQQGDPTAMRSELYALDGYAEILLADLFCSGIPLSTLDFRKDFTYHTGATADQVYQDAINKLDSAAALAKVRDSTRLYNLALVLKGRAWLDRGNYDSAAAAVVTVPDSFQYQLQIPSGSNLNWMNTNGGTVSDREGETGLPFLSSGDPRTAVVTTVSVGQNGGGQPFIPLTFPTKYSQNLSGAEFGPFTVADGLEARLIQAEVALQKSPNDPAWLTILNTLRASMPVPGTTQPATQTQLPPLTDPGESPRDIARVSLLFQERAYWLFLTGHRQGDLRRLIRQYGQSPDQVYPTGPYLAPGDGLYGTDVTAPIPGAEYANPLFHGCIDRKA